MTIDAHPDAKESAPPELFVAFAQGGIEKSDVEDPNDCFIIVCSDASGGKPAE